MITRRSFIKQVALGLAAMSMGGMQMGCTRPVKGKLTFGVISDVHEELQADAKDRLKKFLADADGRSLDFIIQLGDMSHGNKAQEMMDIWNTYAGPRYSVLGNHDLDHANKEKIVRIQQMEGPYYSFDAGPFHCVALDLNHVRKDGQIVDFDHGNYYVDSKDRDLISPEELAWLCEDLEATDKPTILFSHQGLDEVWDGMACPNRSEVRALFREINQKQKKVVACFCGHHHVDAYSQIEGVHYVQINSASYHWVDGDVHFSKGNMAEYKDGLYAFVTLDLDADRLLIEGQQSEFLPPAPTADNCENGDKIFPWISDRDISLLI